MFDYSQTDNMNSRLRHFVAIFGLLAALPARAQHVEIGADPPDFEQMFGKMGKMEYTVGQTFKAPSADFSVLDRFTLWSAPICCISQDTRYNAYLMEWGGTGVVGDVLFRSALMSGPLSPYNRREDYALDGISLNPTSTYIFFLSTVEHFREQNEAGMMLLSTEGHNPSRANQYADGEMRFVRDYGDFDRLSSQYWNRTPEGSDLMFRAEFSATPVATPEPATFSLLGFGLIGIAGLVGVRKRLNASR